LRRETSNGTPATGNRYQVSHSLDKRKTLQKKNLVEGGGRPHQTKTRRNGEDFAMTGKQKSSPCERKKIGNSRERNHYGKDTGGEWGGQFQTFCTAGRGLWKYKSRVKGGGRTKAPSFTSIRGKLGGSGGEKRSVSKPVPGGGQKGLGKTSRNKRNWDASMMGGNSRKHTR